jgi:hypothetical protein
VQCGLSGPAEASGGGPFSGQQLLIDWYRFDSSAHDES